MCKKCWQSVYSLVISPSSENCERSKGRITLYGLGQSHGNLPARVLQSSRIVGESTCVSGVFRLGSLDYLHFKPGIVGLVWSRFGHRKAFIALCVAIKSDICEITGWGNRERANLIRRSLNRVARSSSRFLRDTRVNAVTGKRKKELRGGAAKPLSDESKVLMMLSMHNDRSATVVIRSAQGRNDRATRLEEAKL